MLGVLYTITFMPGIEKNNMPRCFLDGNSGFDISCSLNVIDCLDVGRAIKNSAY